MTTKEAMRELLSEPMPADTEGRTDGSISFRRLTLKVAINDILMSAILLGCEATRSFHIHNVYGNLEHLREVYKRSWADLFDIASKVTPDSDIILFIGVLCFIIEDQPSIAEKFYMELTRQSEIIGDKKMRLVKNHKEAAKNLLIYWPERQNYALQLLS